MVSSEDLEAVSVSLAKSIKPKLKATTSLDKAVRMASFGSPQIDISSTTTNNLHDSIQQPIQIKLSSPTIKKRITKAPEEQKKLVQEADIDKLISHGEFSADAISFIPYGAGFLTAHEALAKLGESPVKFKTLQENYLSNESLNFVIEKIPKIYDLDNTQKEKLYSFYTVILDRRLKNSKEIEKAKTIMAKIKNKSFRTQLGTEISRMIPDSGNLYKYYSDFDLIDEVVKKTFLAKINEIDSYILKKVKELLGFNKIDLAFRWQEILDFSQILESRNILMINFHQQVEHLLAQKKAADELKNRCEKLVNEIKQLAYDFGKNGKFGITISRSRNIINKIKTSYFMRVQQLIDPSLTRLQKTIFDLELGNYFDLESINQRIDGINPEQIRTECKEIFDKFSKQQIVS